MSLKLRFDGLPDETDATLTITGEREEVLGLTVELIALFNPEGLLSMAEANEEGYDAIKINEQGEVVAAGMLDDGSFDIATMLAEEKDADA